MKNLIITSFISVLRYASLLYALYLSSISRILFYAIIRIIKREFVFKETIGIALICIGILMIFIESEITSDDLLKSNLGNFFALISAFLAAFYFEINSSYRLSHFPFFLGNLIKAFILFVSFALITILGENSGVMIESENNVVGWVDIEYLWVVILWTLICGVIGTFLPLMSLKIIEPSRYTVFITVEPVITISFLFIFNVESLHYIVVGSLVFFILGYFWILSYSKFSESQILLKEQNKILSVFQQDQQYIQIGVSQIVEESSAAFEMGSDRLPSNKNLITENQNENTIENSEEIRKKNEEEDDRNSLCIVQKMIKYNYDSFQKHLQQMSTQIGAENLQQYLDTLKLIQNNSVYQKYEEIINYCLVLEAQGDWELLHKNPHQTLYSKKSSFFNENFLIQKTTMDLEINFPLGLVKKLFYDENTRPKWDKNTTQTRILSQISQHEFIGYCVNKSPIPFMSDRDFVDRYIIVEEDDIIIFFSSSCKYEGCPPSSKLARADCIVNSNIIRRIHSEPGVTVILTMIMQSDVKFKVPQDLIKKMFPSTMESWYQKFKVCINEHVNESPDNKA